MTSCVGTAVGSGQLRSPTGHAHVVVTFVNDRGGCRPWWTSTVARPPSAQVSSVVRASGRRPSILQVHLSSAITSVGAYSERERRAGGVGGGGAEPTLPSRGPSEGLQ